METFALTIPLLMVISISILIPIAVLLHDKQISLANIVKSNSNIWIENRSRQWSKFITTINLYTFGQTLSVKIDTAKLEPGQTKPVSLDANELHNLLSINKGWRRIVSKTIGWPCLITVRLDHNEKIRRLICL